MQQSTTKSTQSNLIKIEVESVILAVTTVNKTLHERNKKKKIKQH
jgi:hypothetical protein